MKKELSLKRMFAKLIIGGILLGFCWQYLSVHPAEKEAITSGFTIMYDKLEMRWHGLRDKEDASLVTYRQQLDQGYRDLLNTAEYTSSCQNTEVVETIDATRNSLMNQNMDEFEASIAAHFARYLDLQEKVNAGCLDS